MKQAPLAALAMPVLAIGQSVYNIPSSTAPGHAVFESFMSYSIELSSFPEFAGNVSHPITYSDTLLQNIADISGSKPYIRVGGNTQDYAIYNASLPFAINGTYNLTLSPDYPTTIFIGPSFFESYMTWEDVKFSHGLNFGLGGSTSAGWQSLLETVPLVCEALRGKLYAWQYGNEPDLYSTSTHGVMRPKNWNETTYVSQWQNGTRAIKSLIQKHCPDVLEKKSYGYFAPAFGGVGNKLNATKAWAAGLNSQNDINLFSTHNYISGASTPGVTLQSTLLNHTRTIHSITAHLTEYAQILSLSPSTPAPPLIFGEHNSLYNQGRPGLSNTFGAALWGLDFNLFAASSGFKRVHMHQGTNYRYASWQPVDTTLAPKGTKPPYYGNVAVAAALGDLTKETATVVHIPSQAGGEEGEGGEYRERLAVYAIYTDDGATLARIVAVNMRGYNTTVSGAGVEPLQNPPERREREFRFHLPVEEAKRGLTVRRLMANGSDAITGVTWDGWSYDFELDEGRPARLGNVTVGERVRVGEDGGVVVKVQDSSAVVVSFVGGYEEEDGSQ